MYYVSNKKVISILRYLVQIPTENPSGITDEIINFLYVINKLFYPIHCFF